MASTVPALPQLDEALAQSVATELASVEDSLREAVASHDALMRWTARHLLDAGGKRVRPLLTLLAASFGTMSSTEVRDAAVLVELTHLASLYHDDVMDSAPTRRGAASAHEVWGNNVAILTGDFLFARASALSAGLGAEVSREHAHTFERLCLGQLHETVGPSEGDDPFDHYIGVLRDKTASLLALAGGLGADTSGAPAEIGRTLREYGEIVGVAFQLADDVLDLRSDAEISGKTPGTDLREGVSTMPVLLVRRRADEGDVEAQRLVELLDGDLSDDAALAQALDALRSHPAVEETDRMARSMAQAAIDVLERLPHAAGRDALIEFTRTLVDRGR
ncbi:polyprenyl synthetase family protein [Brachybacterium sp. EF45031]|uniref:polyprenyl synthetase family protein n=1 Tax=Brachybacterium sillae TaxID=2810536 RepID=UPI00217EAA40|nr:polyprenyl synthetase family protein [Brachybacterium sillae]MCS6711097.1 polyprenyl synthetase family protein [Brachybacterium sillae]